MAFMFCPNCKGITEIKSTGASKQLQKQKRVFFKRNRTCQACNTEFTTVEIDEKESQELENEREINKKIYELIRGNHGLSKRLNRKNT